MSHNLEYAAPPPPRFRPRFWVPLVFLGAAVATLAHVLFPSAFATTTRDTTFRCDVTAAPSCIARPHDVPAH